ncbi:restriction endonuclease subunit S [uncultured Olegusella sp.]|uniref:restriction endonuclease subunit S n=1 Tax=uncultured Olegusella sp. TaxID=1979846 RepID=UPI002624C032|nr:restriction endonuclease subunit S [uncultured Olegusella sp.]
MTSQKKTRLVPLSEIARIYNGNSINTKVKKEKYLGLNDGLPYIGTKDVGFDGAVDYETGVRIPTGEPKFKTAPAGTVFVCAEGGSAGKKTALIDREVCFGNKLFAIVADSSVCDPEYLYLFTSSPQFKEQFKALMGGLIGGVTAAKFGSIEIPLIPLEEQQMTAKEVSTQLTALSLHEKSVASLFTKTNHLYQHFIDSTLDDLAEKTFSTLGEHLNEKPRNGKSVRPNPDGRGVRSLSLSATTSGYFDPQYFKYVDIEVPEDSYLWLEPNDILVQRANTIDYVGTAAIYTGGSHEFIYPDLMMKLTPTRDVTPQFMLLQLQSTVIKNYFKSHATGTAGNMPKINQKTVINAPFIMVESAVQKMLMDRVSSVQLSIEQMKDQLENVAKKLELLRLCILQNTFAGNTVSEEK